MGPTEGTEHTCTWSVLRKVGGWRGRSVTPGSIGSDACLWKRRLCVLTGCELRRKALELTIRAIKGATAKSLIVLYT